MDSLFLLQFTCFLFVSINAIILGITRLQIKWMNRRYEKSRWLIFAAMVGLALQFLAQMGGNFGRKATMREPYSTCWSILPASRSSPWASTISRPCTPISER